MKLETFFEKFDQFADAPDAVAKMRELVLEFAVQGKLVPQDPNDEPAAELIARIENTKEEQIRQRMIKRVAVDPNPIGDACESLPPGWLWTRLGNTFDVRDGTHDTPKYTIEGFPLITSKNISSGSLLFDGASLISEVDHRQISERSRVDRGDILFAMIGSIGNPVIVDTDREFSIKNVALFKFYAAADSEPRFLLLYLKHVAEEMKAKAAGGVQSFVSLGFLRNYLFPLPPLAEQRRIVAKVDELMALCDRLEAQQQEREARHAVLARASLARFADAPNPATLRFLFHPSYAISPADLRKVILTLAVQGKLVPQDPNDEPADELVARLEQERARMASEQGVRPPKNVPQLTADSYPHDIPESWQWRRIGHLALVIDYGTSQKADNDSSKVPVYRMGNIVGGRLVNENLKYVDASIDDLPGLYLKTDDILFNRTNSYELVGKAGIYTGPDDTATFASYLIRVRLPKTLLFPPFYSVAMNAPYYRQTQIEPEVVQQCGQANFNGTKLASTVVPVPPLAEQRRIVAKVDQLMALVDELETQLGVSRATAANLLSALVAELTT